MADSFKIPKLTQPSPTGPFIEELAGAVVVSTGAADAGKVPVLGPDGKLDASVGGGNGGGGSAATIQVGTVTTGEPGTEVSVTNSGTETNAILDFTIPRGADGAQGSPGVDGAPGPTGAAATVAIGTVSSGSDASVTNTGTETDAVLDFILPKGDQGEQGIPGVKGDPGQAATIAVGTVTTLAAGSQATVTNVGTSLAAVFDFGIPQGSDGGTGTTATVAVGSTTTGVPGTQAQVTNSGDSTNVVLDFVIPEGQQGVKGDTGADGYTPVKGVDYFDGAQGIQGIQGTPGNAATVNVGSTTTLPAGSSATVSNSGTISAAILDFQIPQGAKGDQGEPGVGVPVGGSTGQVLSKNSNADYDTEWVTPSTGGGSLPSRSDVVLTTAVIADQSVESGSLALGKMFAIVKVVASAPCRIRLYSSEALRDADLTRDRFTPPTPGSQHGVIGEWVLSDVPLPDKNGNPITPCGLSFIASPLVEGADVDAVTGNINYAVTNLSGSNQSIQVTFTRTLGEQ